MSEPAISGNKQAVRDEQGRFVAGVSGNPAGKPVGATSLKTFVRDFLLDLTPEQKTAYIDAMAARGQFLDVWKMAEGNPHSTSDETIKHILPTPILDLPPVSGEVKAVLPESTPE